LLIAAIRSDFPQDHAGEQSGRGIGLWVNLDVNSCRAELGHHFVEVANSKIEHPDFVPEKVALLPLGLEDCRCGFLLPDGVLARWRERSPKMLQIPMCQRFRIFGPEEEAPDSGHSLHIRSFQFTLSTARAEGAGIADCAAVCAIMTNSLRVEIESAPKANDRIRSNLRL
jgi:hypothetical protein